MRAKDYGINLEDLKIPPGNLKRPVAKKPKRKLQFYKFPVRVMESVLEKYGSAQAGPCFAILLVLYEAWYLDFKHRHKIRLSSTDLARYGVSKDQKRRALEMLVKANIVTIDGTVGKNPWVTCHWLASR